MQQPKTMGEALKRLRVLSDRLDRIKHLEKQANEEWEMLEKFAADESARSGVGKWAAGGVTLSVEKDFRVSYDPEKWDDLLRWAVETGNTAIVQRRMGETAVKALIDSGQGQPVGVKLSVYDKVSVRRA